MEEDGRMCSSLLRHQYPMGGGGGGTGKKMRERDLYSYHPLETISKKTKVDVTVFYFVKKFIILRGVHI